MSFSMAATTRFGMIARLVFLCIFGCCHYAQAVSLDPKIKVNTASLITMCTGAALADYPPNPNGIAAAKKLCEPPASLHSKCNNDDISKFVNAAAGQCLYTFPDVNEEQRFTFSGVSIVENDGTDMTTDVVKVLVTAFYSNFALDLSRCPGCTVTENPNPLPHASKVEIRGPAASVNDLLADALILPQRLENNLRMISPCLLGVRCAEARASPVEVIDIIAARDGSNYPIFDVYNSTAFPTSAERFFVRIVPFNNGPNFDSGNPMKTFVPCRDCSGNKGLEPDFGQYFTFEGSSSLTVTISGLLVKDEDFYEGCNTVTTCLSRQVSVNIDTAVGVVRLNTLSDLILQNTGSNTLLSFVGTLEASNAAIRSILYDVVTTSTSSSASRFFNTQKLNGPSEAVSVTVSDQGYSGQSGFANATTLRFPITVVAVNQAPKSDVCKSPSSSLEGVTITIAGPAFSDNDIADITLSTYAQREWYSSFTFKSLRNKMSILINSPYGKMIIPTLRDVDVSVTDLYYPFTIKDLHPDSGNYLSFLYFHELIELLHANMRDWCVTADPEYNVETQKITSSQFPCFIESGASSIYFYLDRRKLARDGKNLKSVSPLLEQGLMFLQHGDKFRNFFGRKQNDFEYFCFAKPLMISQVYYLQEEECPESDASIIKDLSMDLRATCGGWPKRLGGRLCQSDSDCSSVGFPIVDRSANLRRDACTPKFKYSPDSASSTRDTSCYCCNPHHNDEDSHSKRQCSADSECGQDDGGDDISSCGCTAFKKGSTFPCSSPPCSDPYPFPKFPFDISRDGPTPLPDQNDDYNHVFLGQSVKKCMPVFSLSPGSATQISLNQVQTYMSKEIGLVGTIENLNNAISSIVWQSDPFFNWLFRPPPCIPPNENACLTPAQQKTFDMNANFLAPVFFSANDNGNSGGHEHSPQTTTCKLEVPIEPVNDAPAITDFNPGQLCNEGSSIHLNMTISDKDEKDYRFDKYIFHINISVVFGSLSFESNFVISENLIAGGNLIAPVIRGSWPSLIQSSSIVFRASYRAAIRILSHPSFKYTPKPLYNTDAKEPEYLSFVIIDKNDVKPDHTVEIVKNIAISSVNNPPSIGRCSRPVGSVAVQNPFTPGCPPGEALFRAGLFANNVTMTLIEDLRNKQGQKPDPFAWVNSSYLLITDPDSSEARSAIRTLLSKDPTMNLTHFTSQNYGALFVELDVTHGTISVIPAPPFQLKHPITYFYPNCTYAGRKNKCVPCGPPVLGFGDVNDHLSLRECVSGRRVVFETQHEVLVEGATSSAIRLIRYIPDQFFNGLVSLRVFVSDQGFYSRTGVINHVNDTLMINVKSYNNIPVLIQPLKGQDSTVMQYQRGIVCNATFCLDFGKSRIPTIEYAPLSIFDQDITDGVDAFGVRKMLAASTRGQLQVKFLIERLAGGNGLIVCRNCSSVFVVHSVDFIGFAKVPHDSVRITGGYSEVNDALGSLVYNAHPDFAGYEVIYVHIDDFGNSGEVQPEPLYSITGTTIDVIVGAAMECSAYETCSTCTSSIRCGWCPGICQGAGACLDGVSAPKYTTCPPHPIDGRMYNQCTVQFPNAIEVLVIVAGAAVGGSFIAYHFFMFVNRKHGDVSSFLKKKKLDATALGSRLYLLPPEAAIWSQFLAAVVFVAAFFVLVQNFAGLAVFRVEPDPFNDYFIPSAASISIAMDNCHVRIINSEGYFGPNQNILDTASPLPGLVLRFDIMKDSQVSFVADVCSGQQKAFSVLNSRPSAVRYNGFHCNIQIVVPKNYILPTLIFTAAGSNVSYIRGGALDPDVKTFSDFSFGPNSLEMHGTNLDATFGEIKAVKSITYKVDSGRLEMKNVKLFSVAKLNSTSASIIMSTPLACDSRFLQQSRNDVCISSFQSFITPECTQRSFYPALVLDPPENCPVNIDCGNYQQLCSISPNCIGTGGQRGFCDTIGACTVNECTGRYTGLLVNQPGDISPLIPKIEMSSTLGILSLSCFEPSLPLSMVSVNKKVEGDDIDMNPDDHVALDESFHPGGGVRPQQDWWNLFLRGAGTVENSEGTFVWLSNARYLVLAPAFLDVVSLGLLSPDRGKSLSNLQPGFCPPTPSSNDDKARRIIAQYKLLRRKLELTPSQKETKLPAGSFITFINTTSQEMNLFSIDPSTNEVSMTKVDPSAYPLLNSLVYLAIAIPALFSFVVVSSLAWKYHLGVIEKRIKMYRHDMVAKQMLLTPDVAEADIEAEVEDTRWDNSNLKMYEIYGKVGPFYMLDEYVDSAERQKSVLKLIAESVRHALIVTAPTALVLLFASSYQNSQLVHMCEFRVDRARCMATPIPLVNIIFYVVAAYVASAFLELMGYYLRLGFNAVRSLIRHVFYIGYFVVTLLACVYLILLMLWCIIGVLLSPSKMAPYAAAVVTFIAHAASLFARLKKTQVRVQKMVVRRVGMYKSRMKDTIAPAVLEIIMSKNVDQGLHDAGFSVSRVIVSVASSCIVLLILFVFLFVGFRAFTNPTDLVAGVINTLLVIGTGVALNQSEGGRGEQDGVLVEDAAKHISERIKDVLEMVAKQIQTGMRLIDAMNRVKSEYGPDAGKLASNEHSFDAPNAPPPPESGSFIRSKAQRK